MRVTDEQLKPCPFCGGGADIERPGTMRQSMIVACTECGCRVESGDVFGMTEPEHWRWNRRAALEAALAVEPADEITRLTARVAELEGALEPFARLELPKRPQGNAGAWSLLHDDIRRAKAALERKP